MRKEIEKLIHQSVTKYNITGNVLEIGAFNSILPIFKSDRFSSYVNLTLHEGETKLPDTIFGDITKKETLPNSTYDLIVAVDVFEHIDRPWLAAENISDLLTPNGICIIVTVWSWRYHPCPIDYWRFSPDCLAFLFSGISPLEKGFDSSRRRDDIRGFWKNGLDKVPVDELGGWRENWTSYYIGKNIKI